MHIWRDSVIFQELSEYVAFEKTKNTKNTMFGLRMIFLKNEALNGDCDQTFAC